MVLICRKKSKRINIKDRSFPSYKILTFKLRPRAKHLRLILNITHEKKDLFLVYFTTLLYP